MSKLCYLLVTASVVAIGAPLELLEVHGAEGQLIYINPHEISSLREPTNEDLRKHFAPGVHCVIVATNGKLQGIRERCIDVRNALTGKAP